MKVVPEKTNNTGYRSERTKSSFRGERLSIYKGVEIETNKKVSNEFERNKIERTISSSLCIGVGWDMPFIYGFLSSTHWSYT